MLKKIKDLTQKEKNHNILKNLKEWVIPTFKKDMR